MNCSDWSGDARFSGGPVLDVVEEEIRVEGDHITIDRVLKLPIFPDLVELGDAELHDLGGEG